MKQHPSMVEVVVVAVLWAVGPGFESRRATSNGWRIVTWIVTTGDLSNWHSFQLGVLWYPQFFTLMTLRIFTVILVEHGWIISWPHHLIIACGCEGCGQECESRWRQEALQKHGLQLCHCCCWPSTTGRPGGTLQRSNMPVGEEWRSGRELPGPFCATKVVLLTFLHFSLGC